METGRHGLGRVAPAPRAAVLVGAIAGTLVAAFVLLGSAGLEPVDGFVTGTAAALQVDAADRHPGAPVAPGHGREQFLTLSNAGRARLDRVVFAVGVNGDARLGGPDGLVVDVDVCTAIRVGEDRRCTQPVSLVEGVPLEHLNEPVALPGLHLAAGERAHLRVVLTLPSEATSAQGATARLTYRFAAS